MDRMFNFWAPWSHVFKKAEVKEEIPEAAMQQREGKKEKEHDAKEPEQNASDEIEQKYVLPQLPTLRIPLTPINTSSMPSIHAL